MPGILGRGKIGYREDWGEGNIKRTAWEEGGGGGKRGARGGGGGGGGGTIDNDRGIVFIAGE